jgi:hypothetical protein
LAISTSNSELNEKRLQQVLLTPKPILLYYPITPVIKRQKQRSPKEMGLGAALIFPVISPLRSLLSTRKTRISFSLL